MLRIKLPGKEKHKKILLIILVIIAIGIIAYDKLEKNRLRAAELKKENQQEIIKPADIEESNGNNTTNKKVEKNNDDISEISSNATKNEKKIYSDKENQLYNEAYTAFFSHEYINAINKADSLIREFPGNAMGYNIRGIAKAYNGDYDGGMKDIDMSLSIDSTYGYARFNKALTYELYGKMSEALQWYNKDLEVEEYVWSYYGIASIYGRKGDVKNTMTYLNKAIQLDSEVKSVAKTEHDFEPVKDSEEFKKAVNN